MSRREERAAKGKGAKGKAASDGAGAGAPHVLPMGERVLLLELPTLEDALTWNESVRTDPLAGQEWSVVAARTVLVRFRTSNDARAAAREIAARTPGAGKASAGRTRRIGVVYDGEDLEEVARATGLSADAVVAAHTGTPWRAAFGGFAPGFVYLTGGDARLAVPRRDSPRTRVPAGAVALAGEFSAVYPKASPGGWQLVGRTDAVLFDPDAKDPALIRPGDTVRFEARRESARVMRREGRAADDRAAGRGASGAEAADSEASAAGAAAPPLAFPDVPRGAPALEILAPGLRTLVEDTGRPGLGDLGVTTSGAVDGPSARQANRLVGNAPDAAVLETLLGGLSLRAHGDLVLALTGAIGEAVVQRPATGATGGGGTSLPEHAGLSARAGLSADASPSAQAGSEDGVESGGGVESDGDVEYDEDVELGADVEYDEDSGAGEEVERSARPKGSVVSPRGPFGLRDGETLTLTAPSTGLRGYVAVRGGLEVPAQLGSRAADTLSGLGPRPLAAGDVLAVGDADPHRSVGSPEEPATLVPDPSDVPVLRIRRGPRADWAEEDALLERTWIIGGDSDRVGARLEAADGGAPVRRVRSEELASEGMVPGAVQLPPSGLPVVFLADHPVTGGYPVIAVVDEADLPLLAQLPPGRRVRFAAAR
jgi:KipI family sensor histidine kinase inhibitor